MNNKLETLEDFKKLKVLFLPCEQMELEKFGIEVKDRLQIGMLDFETKTFTLLLFGDSENVKKNVE